MKNKRLFSFLLIMALVFSSFLGSGKLALAAEMEGDGTELSPYLIKTVSDLYDMQDLTAHYKLANNLDFEDKQRQPIDAFEGVLDGGGYVIKNLNIYGIDKVGLFGTLTNATIKNLGIETAIVKSDSNNTGVFFGTASDSTLKNCYVKNANVSGNIKIGGIGGYTSSNTILDNCYVQGAKIEAKGISGGLVGEMLNSKIKQSLAIADVESKNDVSGGLVGYTNGVIIDESYYSGNINAFGSCGGIIGYMFYDGTPNAVNNSYSVGTLTSTRGFANGIYGDVYNSNFPLNLKNCYSSMASEAPWKEGISQYSTTGNTKNSYFDSTIIEITTPIVQARTTEQLYKENNFVDWDFENIWSIDEGKGYPKLRFAEGIEGSIPGESEPGTPNPDPNPNPTELNFKMVLEIGEKLQLSLNNSLIINEEATWTSSDDSILTVDSKGVAKALKAGTVVVTVNHYEEDYTEKIHILVVPDATYLRLAVDLKVGESALATIDDLTYTKAVVWSSDNTDIATVSKRGKIVARGKGLAMVTATGDDGKEIGHVYVRVR